MPAKKSPEADVLDLYTAVSQQIDAHMEKNADVFAELARLEDQRRVAEENLKSAVRATGENIENARFVVKASPAFKKWFDWSKIKEIAKKPELAIIEKEAVRSVEIDPAAMQRLVMEGKIGANVVQAAFREEPLTTRVTIAKKS